MECACYFGTIEPAAHLRGRLPGKLFRRIEEFDSIRWDSTQTERRIFSRARDKKGPTLFSGMPICEPISEYDLPSR